MPRLMTKILIIQYISDCRNNYGENFTANNYLFKVNNKNARKRCEICSKLTIKTPERRH